MSEFGEMIKEALLGEESFDPSPGAEAVKAVLQKFDRRMWTVRVLSWFVVAFMFALAIVMIVFLLQAPADESPGLLLLYAVLAVFGMTGVGMAKGYWFLMQNHFALMKEVKRTQLLLIEKAE